MAARVIQVGSPQNVTASAQIGKVGQSVQTIGFFVNTTTAGTIQFRHNGVAVGAAITPAAGNFYPYPADFPLGCDVVVANTLDCTVFYAPNS
jgi:hypothetical protein